MNQPYGGQLKRIFFIGIGGIGMSALARYFRHLGCAVSGYDKTPTPLTDALIAEGIAVHFEDAVELLDKVAELVVYTPAIPAQHTQLNWYRDNGFEVIKRSDVLQRITEQSRNICIGGTHGKTTITTMTAHLFRHSGLGCNAFLGGISANYDTNFWASDNDLCVIEADEYDRSFLKLRPDVAVVTAMDADHLDIYGTPEEVVKAYQQFAGGVKPTGLLIHKLGLDCTPHFKGSGRLTYHFADAAADAYVAEWRVVDGSYVYTVKGKDWSLNNLTLHMGGLHNLENTLPAILAAKHYGMEDEAIAAAIAAFKGVKRRFEYYVRTENRVMIDDYAHHPEELRALITGVRSLYPGRKLSIVFQPHLFSRTNDLKEGFAEVLGTADEVILLPIYPARELPMPGVTSATITGLMNHGNTRILEKEEMTKWVDDEKPSLLVTAGAGDIDALLPQLHKMMSADA